MHQRGIPFSKLLSGRNEGNHFIYMKSEKSLEFNIVLVTGIIVRKAMLHFFNPILVLVTKTQDSYINI